MTETGNHRTSGSGTFKTTQVARIVGVPPERVRSWVRAGMCQPARRGRILEFSFQDLVLLRTACGLLQQRVPPYRVRRALRELTRQLPAERPLSALRFCAEGREVVVRDGRVAWQPESGQTVFLFEVGDLARCSGTLVRADQHRAASEQAAAENQDPAADWFERALAVEDDDPQQACLWYRKALDLNPELADAYVNLGRLIHEAGDAVEAVRLYHQALKRVPSDAVGHYNLALAFEDLRKQAAAARHYRHAIRTEPGFADAHFNLARVLEKLGRKDEASWHFLVYSKLTSVT
jgi:tetratricopeptide (TPR) repeat protein